LTVTFALAFAGQFDHLVVPRRDTGLHRQALGRSLGEHADVARGRGFLVVEVDLEVRRLEDRERQLLVLDLVASEVLRFGGRCGAGERRQAQQQGGERFAH